MSPDNPLQSIRTFTQLVKYLRDELDWPIESDDFEELTFDYAPEELGLDAETAVKIKEIKQLRPLATRQPWGIFFVNFAPKQLPVVALRRILSSLVIKKRQSANQAQRAAWRLHDLLFISSYGESEHRDISFAHFAEESAAGDLPTLRLLGWDDEDTKLKLDYVERQLKDKLKWPADENNVDGWRTKWSAAFQLRPREVVKTSRQLAERLADLARGIRKRANNVLAVESDMGPLRRMHAAFKEALIHDLSTDDFADMYAQTISYGLLTARISRPAGLVADNLADMVPVTNPFLKELLETFLTVGGRKGKIDFDELGVNDVVQLLRDADMEAVLRDFGDRNPQEDPVIHFYELFLKEYDAKKRMQRGVFYTPRPVVSFIVRSVDEILRTEFKLEDGLADTATWGEMAQRHADLQIPAGVSPEQPFVQILDPATGTGTFLVEAIDVIHRTMEAKWHKQGHMPLEFQRMWNEYVPQHLLPRIYGFELMMAPYAIAHMKIGLKLFETGYTFGSDERARVYLTNSLELAGDSKQMSFADWVPALAHEARAVNAIKNSLLFTIIIGNPPYSASISEPAWLMAELRAWKEGLNETKIDLNREEWKFFRFSQLICAKSKISILGFVINRDFLDGVAKRKMRDDLQATFPHRTIVDLNGDVKGNIADENVFEITQGVCVAILRRGVIDRHNFLSLIGTRNEKYSLLSDASAIDNRLSPFKPSSPYFRWVPFQDSSHSEVATEYLSWLPLNEVFSVYSSGIQTKRDGLCVNFDRQELWTKIQHFDSLTVAGARRDFELGEDGRDWTVAGAKADIAASGPNKRYITQLLYRPFDPRFTYWTGKTKGFLAYPRREVMRHVVDRENIGLIFNRQIVGDSVSHFGVSKIPICHGTFYLGNKGQDYFAPLALYEDGLLHSSGLTSHPNFTAKANTAFAQALGPEEANTSKDIFRYIYAVFHSPQYRTRYGELLKIDFPRLPLPGSLKLFRALSRLGDELVALHLLESTKLDSFNTEYIGGRAPEVEKVSLSKNTVWLDREQTTGFKGVREEVWNFHIGGYQVCEKWLKDRKGRKLLADDIRHYQKIVVALSETIRLMKKIDEVIEEHGGWPGAFSRQTK